MKINYLFPNKFKTIGWVILIPSAVVGLFSVIYEYEPSFLDFNVPSLSIDPLFNDDQIQLFGMIKNNLLNEILGVLVIVSALFVALSFPPSLGQNIEIFHLENDSQFSTFQYVKKSSIDFLTILKLWET